MRIGVVDLDTSHPAAFLPLLRQRGHEVVAVYGGRTVVDDDYTRAYAAEHGLSVVADPDDLLGTVDAAFIHSVDWDHHLVRARPFAEAGVPIHICKPFAGRAADLREMIRWADSGVRLSGGSALRWSAAVADWQATGHEVLTAYAATYGHPLDYGIHAYALLSGLLGPGVEAARSLDDEGRRVELRWRDGRTAVVAVAPPGTGGYGFFATLVHPEGVHHVEAGGSDLYGRFIDVTVGHLSGERDQPVSFAELVEPELAVIAGLASAKHGGSWIALHGDSRIDDVAFDGKDFAASYRITRRKALGLS
ncbi:Gfo/Idh/MocA family oxidoreductase [Kribbella endophytica]